MESHLLQIITYDDRDSNQTAMKYRGPLKDVCRDEKWNRSILADFSVVWQDARKIDIDRGQVVIAVSPKKLSRIITHKVMSLRTSS